MAEKKKIILDVDTGTDDAIAIMTAYLDPGLDLLAVCTVAGNKPLPYTTENTLRVRDVLQADFPVYKGCATPMVSTLLPSRHGSYSGQRTIVEGMDKPIEIHTDYLELPPSTRTVEKEHAVWFYIDTLMRSAGDITLVPVGPLTNIAMAMRLEPEICKKIREIVLMGGGYQRTNTTAAAEFNIWADPEAAQIVMDSGCPIRIIPLDATHHGGCINADESREFRALGTALGKAVADCVDHRILAYSHLQPMDRLDSAPIHDALAVCAVAHPEIITKSIFTRVDIDISGGFADGQTIVDPRTYTDRPKNATFALDADREMFARWMMDCIRSFRPKQ